LQARDDFHLGIGDTREDHIWVDPEEGRRRNRPNVRRRTWHKRNPLVWILSVANLNSGAIGVTNKALQFSLKFD